MKFPIRLNSFQRVPESADDNDMLDADAEEPGSEVDMFAELRRFLKLLKEKPDFKERAEGDRKKCSQVSA